MSVAVAKYVVIVVSLKGGEPERMSKLGDHMSSFVGCPTGSFPPWVGLAVTHSHWRLNSKQNYQIKSSLHDLHDVGQDHGPDHGQDDEDSSLTALDALDG